MGSIYKAWIAFIFALIASWSELLFFKISSSFSSSVPVLSAAPFCFWMYNSDLSIDSTELAIVRSYFSVLGALYAFLASALAINFWDFAIDFKYLAFILAFFTCLSGSVEVERSAIAFLLCSMFLFASSIILSNSNSLLLSLETLPPLFAYPVLFERCRHNTTLNTLYITALSLSDLLLFLLVNGR